MEVLHSSDAGAARRMSMALAKGIGFGRSACEEIGLAVTELGINLIKHAQGGMLTLTPLAGKGRVGLEIESRDSGPGMADVEAALGDRFSTAGTRGTGLGAVNRLMDELDITSDRSRGTRIVCRKWVRQQMASLRPCPLVFGVATRPRRPGAVNGDAFVVRHWGESALAGVIDGLGHGHFAHQAAQAALQYVEGHFDRPLDQIFRGTARACRATRGVVMALARFDWGRDSLSFASIGNIEVRVFPSSKPFHFSIRRGIIGLNTPEALVTEDPWPPGHLLVLHSDGLGTHWGWEDFPGLAEQTAPALAQEFLRTLATGEDDATVIVVRHVTP